MRTLPPAPGAGRPQTSASDEALLILRYCREHFQRRLCEIVRLAGVSSSDVTEVVLKDSFHDATLDYDAPRIFAASVDFVRRLSRTSPGRGADAQ